MSFLNPDPDDDRLTRPSSDTRRALPSDLFLPETPASDGDQSDGIDSITRRLRSSTDTGEPTAAAAKPTLAATIALKVRTHRLLIASVTGVVVLGAVVFWAWPSITRGASSVQASLVAAISNAPDPETPAAAPPESEPPAPPRAVGQSRRRAAQPPIPAALQGQVKAAIEAAPAAITAAPSGVPVASSAPEGSAPVVEPPAPVAARAEPVVYSSADANVQPPKIRSVDVPRTIGGGLPTRTEAVELLVNAQGTVDRVRLRTPNPRMLDPLFLSRAKMWQFEPARRDGVAVPYRLVMSWQVSDR